MTTDKTIREGDRVRVIAPHPEAGAIGKVETIHKANSYYRRRARVRFPDPTPGSEVIRIDWLEKA